MSLVFKARLSILCFLLASVVWGSPAAIGSNRKETASGNLQIAASDNPREALKKSIYARHNVKAYRVRMESSYAGSSSNATMIMEFVLPDRFHIIQNNEEIIVIGHETYRKHGDEQWKTFPHKDRGVAAVSLPAPTLEEEIRAIDRVGDVELIGKDVVEGIQTLVYSRTIDVLSNKTRPCTTKLWLAVADGLIRRSESECQEDSKKVTVVSTYYYDADIKIEPPAQSVELPPEEMTLINPRPEPKADPPAGHPGVAPGAPSVGPGSGGGMGPGGGSPSIGGGTNPNAPATTVDQKPVPLNSPQPHYTEEARRNKIQGIVVARVLIGTDGSVKRVNIVRGLPDGLDEQAVLAAYQLRFRPAMKGGQPVPFWVSVQIEFRLSR